ncbi:ATP-binding cassette sub-family F member 3-like [Artemia franciscana]|uniref:ATP-binding cassette sub-family F member 3 n=1 Tax=Artemia franciscana TaxID=6661 RepID=A0AA88H7L6_ARTSF|nr:hypothetical protein QYM36_016394 [Artemia franciscana]
MENIKPLLRSKFPRIDGDLLEYIEGILETSFEDFFTSDDVYDAIGPFVHEAVDGATDGDVKDLCNQILSIIGPEFENAQNGKITRILDAPIHIGSMRIEGDLLKASENSMWKLQRESVDSKKLERANARIQKKEERKSDMDKPKPTAPVSNGIGMATASQVLSKKDNKAEQRGTNNSKDIRVENFDIAFGDKVLLTGAELTLAYGRRYGFVGRNGLGKTTLLRLLSSKQLQIPSHITVLHVEQEVVGDETPAIQSVLECDTVREGLIAEEKKITQEINNGNTDASLNARLASVYQEMQAIESDKAPARASVILAGLGFPAPAQLKPTREFSGGWRMRLALARALFARPDLLLLDEPTNMLDMKAIIWLEDYLQTWPSTILVVSHDRQFLETVATDIIYLHSQRLDSYRGNYSHFIKAKTEKAKNQHREWEAQQQLREHVQEFIDKFRYNAKRASLVQSKIKFLEKLPVLQPVEKETEVVLRFQDAEPLNPPAVQLDEMSFGYTKDKILLKNVNLTASNESRICIVGENGAGKTTLLKILVGDLEATSGFRHLNRSIRLGYFSQHFVDNLDLNSTPVDAMKMKVPGKTVEEYRRLLGSFGISGDKALQKVVSLSGGQKCRVALAVMAATRPNFLMLDEPTNHLDIETIEALGKAIDKFSGGLILVSHDERLIRMVCKELWLCADGVVRSIEGGFDEYRKLVEDELKAQ